MILKTQTALLNDKNGKVWSLRLISVHSPEKYISNQRKAIVSVHGWYRDCKAHAGDSPSGQPFKGNNINESRLNVDVKHGEYLDDISCQDGAGFNEAEGLER